MFRNVDGFLLKLPSSAVAIFAIFDCPLTSLEAVADISSSSSGAFAPLRPGKVLAERGRRNTMGELEKARVLLIGFWARVGPLSSSLLITDRDLGLERRAVRVRIE